MGTCDQEQLCPYCCRFCPLTFPAMLHCCCAGAGALCRHPDRRRGAGHQGGSEWEYAVRVHSRCLQAHQGGKQSACTRSSADAHASALMEHPDKHPCTPPSDWVVATSCYRKGCLPPHYSLATKTTCPNRPLTAPYHKLHVLAFLHEQRWMLSLLSGPTLATMDVPLTPGLCVGQPLSHRRASLEARSAASALRLKWSRILPSSLQTSPRVAW